MTKPIAEDEAYSFAFKGAEFLPAINIAQTVEHLIANRGITEAASHAAGIARVACAIRENEVAADWDEVYRLILARRGM